VIAGIVTPNREATVLLTVFSSGGQQQQIEAMVDTGFNLFLTLPSLRGRARATSRRPLYRREKKERLSKGTATLS
jgi:hypothetical protein